MNIQKIRQLARLIQKEGLSELELQEGDFYVRLRRPLKKEPQGNLPVTLPCDPEPPRNPPKEPIASLDVIHSPLAGTFYRANAPGAPPLVNPGDEVKKGKTLCILEAMKLMNELEAPVDCKIIEILVENAQTVHEGQALFSYKPL